MIHVYFEGRSYNFDERYLGLSGRLAPCDTEIRVALAKHFDVETKRFDSYAIDRRPNGDTLVRPEPVYG